MATIANGWKSEKYVSEALEWQAWDLDNVHSNRATKANVSYSLKPEKLGIYLYYIATE
jgi:hypothetical protein